MSGSGNPFDFSTSDPTTPGPLGVSLGTWRDIASFGGNLAQAANARTASGFLANGPGLAGPLGAAITGTLQQGQQEAAQRAALAGSAASTQSVNIDNLMKSFGITPAAARANIQTQALTKPGFLSDFMGQLNGSPAAVGAPAVSSALSPSASQSSGSIPQDQRMPLVTQAVQGTPVPPAILAGLHDYETGGKWDPSAVNPSTKAFGLQQSLPSTAADPGYNTPPISPGATPLQQSAWSATYLANRGIAAGVKDWTDPAQVTQALIAYHGPQKDANGIDGPTYAQKVLQRAAQYGGGPAGPRAQVPGSFQVAQAGGGAIPTPGRSAQPTQTPGSYTPDQAGSMGQQYIQQADELDRRANAMAVGSSITGLPMGDPAAIHTQAQQTRALGQQLLSAGPEAAAKAGNSNTDIRPGGMARVMGPNGMEWVKNPQLEKQQMPDGSTQYVHISPALPGAPDGTGPTVSPVVNDRGLPVVEKLPPNLQDARNKAYTDFAGKDSDSFLAAQNTQQWLEQMNHAADTMNAKGGFMGTGPTAPARLEFANTVNDILRTAGLPNAFDPSTVASWEELKKATQTAGFELASHYEGHARQAASTIVNATSAVPSQANSPVGFKVVSAGIQEAAQQAIDLHNELTNVYHNNGDLTEGETGFYSRNPAQMYARRAISTVTPYAVTTDKQLGRYLPGTFVKYNNNIVQVPERDGAPPIPEYLKSTPPPQGAPTNGG